jgi:hypothetical protein
MSTFTGETSAQCEHHTCLAEAAKKAQQEVEDELEEQQQESSIELVVQNQTESHRLTRKLWHINNGLGPVVKYIPKRFNKGSD